MYLFVFESLDQRLAWKCSKFIKAADACTYLFIDEISYELWLSYGSVDTRVIEKVPVSDSTVSC